MTALAEMFRFRGRLAWLLIGLVLASSVGQGSLLQFAGTSPGEGAANLTYLLGSGASLLLHELVRTVLARPRTARAEAAAAAAGPFVSLAFGLLVIAFTRVAYVAGLADPIVRALAAVATLNIVIAGVNLVPALPLDGGLLLYGAVWGFGRDRARAARVAGVVTEAAGLMIIAAGVAVALVAAVADAFLWVSVGVLLLASGRHEPETETIEANVARGAASAIASEAAPAHRGWRLPVRWPWGGSKGAADLKRPIPLKGDVSACCVDGHQVPGRRALAPAGRHHPGAVLALNADDPLVQVRRPKRSLRGFLRVGGRSNRPGGRRASARHEQRERADRDQP